MIGINLRYELPLNLASFVFPGTMRTLENESRENGQQAMDEYINQKSHDFSKSYRRKERGLHAFMGNDLVDLLTNGFLLTQTAFAEQFEGPQPFHIQGIRQFLIAKAIINLGTLLVSDLVLDFRKDKYKN